MKWVLISVLLGSPTAQPVGHNGMFGSPAVVVGGYTSEAACLGTLNMLAPTYDDTNGFKCIPDHGWVFGTKR